MSGKFYIVAQIKRCVFLSSFEFGFTCHVRKFDIIAQIKKMGFFLFSFEFGVTCQEILHCCPDKEDGVFFCLPLSLELPVGGEYFSVLCSNGMNQLVFFICNLFWFPQFCL